MDQLVGRALGPYVLEALLGSGGWGVVYRAVAQRLQRPRALKLLLPPLSLDAAFVQRFEREAHLAAGLRHPNIVLIHDIGEADGILYIAMELVEGQSLREVIANEAPLPTDRALRLLEQLAEALDYAHGEGVLHRDLKPANVLVGKGDHVTLLDFGLALAVEATRRTPQSQV